jgi:transcription-repair coupling factor (superfamily II helicase)
MEKIFSGLSQGSAAYFALEKKPAGGTMVVVVKEDDQALWYDNITGLSQLFNSVGVHRFEPKNSFARAAVLRNITEDPSCIVITTPESLLEKTLSPADFKRQLLSFVPDSGYNPGKLLDTLIALGYLRVDFVEEPGQFARRGEVLDIWPPDKEAGLRMIFGDQILESIRFFDISTQRSGDFVPRLDVIPCREKAEAYLSEYLGKEAALYFDSPPSDELRKIYSKHDLLINDPLSSREKIDAGFRVFTRWSGNHRLFVEELTGFDARGFENIILCSNQGEKERLEDVLFENKWGNELPGMPVGSLSEGFYSNAKKLAVFTSQEILYKRRQVSFPKFKAGRRLEGLWEISPRDYVVHEKYGIGRYLGLKKIVRGEQELEYLTIEYKGGDKLYVPVEEFRVVQRYVGVEGMRPRLYSMDTGLWERMKQRAAKGAQELAEELLKLYAERKGTPGHAFGKETHWERELADSFPFDETPDQLKTIAEITTDLEQPHPMERLVCGDVGFGKTEVAIRAAFKVVQESKQVVVLVPTTVLAEQHYNTFTNRLSPFPVKIEMLSRFQLKHKQEQIVKDLREGSVDIVIGTHRLLQKDIEIKDLGLLIIDEEHRFGVKQKEKIKALKKNVDILLLSATPIPRTLSMALANMRDLSVIETPPYGRLPIETHLSPYDEKLLKKIMQAELSRGGQIYYVYNRVETILARGEYLKRLLPDLRFGIVHGQMPAGQIEKTMWQFLHKEIDVLIATTIIESGLDIPSVNTMIVEEAENFGLAQLYQLRGRIGREKQKAYCYLFYSSKELTEESAKRLKALLDLSELGSGFRLALRDLEIRGAGNILSAKQHGFVREIGFDMFSRLIDQASQTLRGVPSKEVSRTEWRTALDFSFQAFLPGDYVEQEDLRIIFYRRLGSAGSDKDLGSIKDELLDRFGKLPLPAENLFKLSEIRILAEKLKLSGISEKEDFIDIYFSDSMEFEPAKIISMVKDFGDYIEFMRGKPEGVKIKKHGLPETWLEFLKKFLIRLGN